MLTAASDAGSWKKELHQLQELHTVTAVAGQIKEKVTSRATFLSLLLLFFYEHTNIV